MAYATLQNLIDRYGEALLIDLTDRADPPVGALDADVVQRALESASALIDGYVGGLYALPVAEVPPLLTQLCEAIACYRLHTYAAPEQIEAGHKEALGSLEKIARGLIRLPIADREPDRNGGSGVQVTDRERPMTAADMTGFI
jgi:phage gp36-like protein